MAKKEKKEEKSELLVLEEEIIEKPKYSTDEENYLMGLRSRMQDARIMRDSPHDEFDGMDYTTYYENNERLANTFIKPKLNKEESNFQSGTIRQKLFASLSAITGLDLRGDISAFNQDGFEVQALGDGMEDIILKTNELDGDDEKKYLRHYELLKQGTVFVEELWEEKKKVSKKSNKKFNGTLKGFEWSKQIKKSYGCPTRNIIPGLNVYLGDITQYDISTQPYVYTVDIVPYSKAKEIFGKWERWENVPKKMQKFTDTKNGVFNSDWTLLESKENHVEIIRYQDKYNNEYALVLNGVLMTPIGLPLSDIWGYEDYNIGQQNLEAIHAKFAYGKALVARVKNKVALLDELMRLAILKTQKSFMPPYLNISGRVLSNRVFMPGKISHGIPPNSLIPINEKETQGVTNSELAMIKEIQESINAETTSPTFSGQQAQGNPTATEIIELQRQSKMVLGLTIFSISMLEWKLEWLRLKNVLANWFREEDKVVDEARGILVERYRKVTTDQTFDGAGNGKRIIIPTKEIPSAQAIMQTEDYLGQEQGMPVRLIFVNPDEVTNAKLIWQIVVRPKERKTSEVNKLMFRAFMQDIVPLGPNIDYLREKAATVWEENPQKLFAPNPPPPMPMGPDGQPIPPEGGGGMSPRTKMPTAEKAMSQKINQEIKMGA